MNAEKTNGILEGLNPRQRAAVEHDGGPLLVVAGAGSGKTRVIVHRIAHIVRNLGVSPRSVLALTFTNKAAAEMKERAALLIGEPAREVTLRTFHSFCHSVLLRHGERVGLRPGFTVYDDDDQKKLVKACAKKIGLPDDQRFTPERIHSIISNAKNFRAHPSDMLSQHDPLTPYINHVADAYEKALLQNNAADFDNLMLKTLELFENNADVLDRYRSRFNYILVDEYQDTNHVQFLLLKTLAGPDTSVTVVGDQDQSIYRWRGADISNIIDFESTFKGATSIALEQNYRSTQHILDAANNLIKYNSGFDGKRLWSEIGAGTPVQLYTASSERDEAEFISDEIFWLHLSQNVPHSDIAVLFRTRAQSRVIEETLRFASVPYQVVGITGFYQRKEVKDIIAYLKLVSNPADTVSLSRIINVPKRGIGPKALEGLLDFFAATGRNSADALDDAASASLPNKTKQFLALIRKLSVMKSEVSLIEFIKAAVKESGYADYLKALDKEEGVARSENVDELISVAMELEKNNGAMELEDYLTKVSLQSDVDNMQSDTPTVKLMTLHCAKGLEFPAIFIAGLEEGILPHHSSLNDKPELEEERRLCYVGVTRAKKYLYLLCSNYRLLFGATRANRPSRFIGEMGGESLEVLETSHRYAGEPGFLDEKPAKPARAATPFVRETGDFRAGDLVEHRVWGRGRVVSIKNGEICVAFDNGQGIKRLAVEYAPVRKI